MAFTAAYNQQRPMSISSITSPLNEMPSPISSTSTSLPYHQYHSSHKPHDSDPFVHYTDSISPKQVSASSTEEKQQVPSLLYFSYSSSESSSLSSSYTTNGIERSPSPSSSSHASKNNQCGNENSKINDSSNSSNTDSTLSPPTFSSTSVSGPLSLQERRQRNKTASAKYRAKKNQQHQGMRAMIHSMTKENDLLLRQLEQTKSENRQLKYVCDKLRSKMMAEKMLKKMLYHQQQQPENHAYFHTPTKSSMDDIDSSSAVSDSHDKKASA